MKQLSVMEDQTIKVNKFFTMTGGCIVLILDNAYLITGSEFRKTSEWITENCFLSVTTNYDADRDNMWNKISVQENSSIYFIGDRMYELTKDELNDFIVQKFI
jgi:hypothetical protein